MQKQHKKFIKKNLKINCFDSSKDRLIYAYLHYYLLLYKEYYEKHKMVLLGTKVNEYSKIRLNSKRNV